jgi:hypothetical protein
MFAGMFRVRSRPVGGASKASSLPALPVAEAGGQEQMARWRTQAVRQLHPRHDSPHSERGFCDPLGLRYASTRPAGRHGLAGIEKSQADRLKVMKAIYDASGGSEHAIVPGPQLLENLGLSDQELSAACRYLQGEHLITSTHTSPSQLTPYYVQITHRGVREVERLLRVPHQPTSYCPSASSVLNVQDSVRRAGGLAGHAFISYVRVDAARVDLLQQALEEAEIPVWRDSRDLWPGQDWRLMIRRAISRDALAFIACFSQASLSKARSYQNEELVLAIDQLRQRSPEQPWLIPVRFDDCQIPDLDLGAGRTLSSIHRADLFGARYRQQLARLIATVQELLRHDIGTAAGDVRSEIADEARRYPSEDDLTSKMPCWPNDS